MTEVILKVGRFKDALGQVESFSAFRGWFRSGFQVT